MNNNSNVVFFSTELLIHDFNHNLGRGVQIWLSIRLSFFCGTRLVPKRNHPILCAVSQIECYSQIQMQKMKNNNKTSEYIHVYTIYSMILSKNIKADLLYLNIYKIGAVTITQHMLLCSVKITQLTKFILNNMQYAFNQLGNRYLHKMMEYRPAVTVYIQK